MSTLRKPVMVGLAILLVVLLVVVMKSKERRQESEGRSQKGRVSGQKVVIRENVDLVMTAVPQPAVSLDPAEELSSLVRRRAALSPAEAAAWVQTLPEGVAKTALLEDVAIVWAEKDPVEALKWASGLPAGENRQVAVRAVGYEAARGEPTNALMAAMALESGPARNQLILYAVSQWSVTDPGSALQWVETVKEGGLRDELFANMATAWAKQDGEAAAMLASRTVRSEATQRRAVVAVVQRWAQTNPAAARKWVESLPDATLRSNCWESIAWDAAEHRPQ